ncbi:MAG: N-acetyltransferase family protein [Terriglobia bacterium]
MLHIRPATETDIPEILKLIRELAEYEKLAHYVVVTPEDLKRDGFSERPVFRVLMAEWDGEPAGYALYFYNYSTFLGRPGIFLEDLFVRPQFRKKGIGKALLLRLAKIAVEERCARVDWIVLDWNTPALEFYKSLGAEVLKEWVTMRLSGEALAKLAALAKD